MDNPEASPYVVLYGNLSEGFRIIGPFASFDAAAEWSSNNSDFHEDWLMELENPASLRK